MTSAAEGVLASDIEEPLMQTGRRVTFGDAPDPPRSESALSNGSTHQSLFNSK